MSTPLSRRSEMPSTVRLSYGAKMRLAPSQPDPLARVTTRLTRVSDARFPLRVEAACDSWHAHVEDVAGKAVTARAPGLPAWELQPVVVRENARRGHTEPAAYPRPVRGDDDLAEFHTGGRHD